MGKTRNYKNKLVKGKKKTGRTRKGGYWLYPSETDKESNIAKLFTFTKKTPDVTETVSEVSIPKDLPEEKPPVEIKAVDTPAPSEVPPPSEPSPEPMPESMPEPESEEQAGGKKRRRRKKHAGDYNEADFAKMFGAPSSSGPKKRGSKEGEAAIAPFKGGDKMLTEKDFKKMMGDSSYTSKLESSVKKGDKEAEKYLKGYIGGETCDTPPCVSGGKRKSRRKRGSKKKHSKKKSHKKTKKIKKSKKSRKRAYKKRK